MEKGLRAIDVARELGVSTSTLRHYERWGVLPPIPRGANGYRQYGSEHIAYLRCIRDMIPGYTLQTACQVAVLVRQGRLEEALQRVNQRQAELFQDRARAEKTIALLSDLPVLEKENQISKRCLPPTWSIGEVCDQAGVTPATLRHWETQGLLRVPRHPDNDYRQYTLHHLQQVFLIQTMRQSDYGLADIQRVLGELEQHNLDNAIRMAEEALAKLRQKYQDQLRGSASLFQLCQVIGAIS